jgi:hypothetical protein
MFFPIIPVRFLPLDFALCASLGAGHVVRERHGRQWRSSVEKGLGWWRALVEKVVCCFWSLVLGAWNLFLIFDILLSSFSKTKKTMLEKIYHFIRRLLFEIVLYLFLQSILFVVIAMLVVFYPYTLNLFVALGFMVFAGLGLYAMIRISFIFHEVKKLRDLIK